MAETASNPGYQTSEFWVGAVTSAVVGLVGLVNESGILHGFQITPAFVVAFITPSVIYILTRFGLKVATVNANAKVDVAKAQADSTTAPTTVTVNNTPSV